MSLCGSRGSGCGRGTGRSRSGLARSSCGGTGVAASNSSGNGSILDVDTTEVPVLRGLVSYDTEDAEMPIGRVRAGRSSDVLDDLGERSGACRSP